MTRDNNLYYGSWEKLGIDVRCAGPLKQIQTPFGADERPTHTCSQRAVIGWLSGGQFHNCFCAECAPEESQLALDSADISAEQ